MILKKIRNEIVNLFKPFSSDESSVWQNIGIALSFTIFFCFKWIGVTTTASIIEFSATIIHITVVPSFKMAMTIMRSARSWRQKANIFHFCTCRNSFNYVLLSLYLCQAWVTCLCSRSCKQNNREKCKNPIKPLHRNACVKCFQLELFEY